MPVARPLPNCAKVIRTPQERSHLSDEKIMKRMKNKMLDKNEILSRVLSPEEWAVHKLWYDQDEKDIGFIVEQLNITSQKAEELLITARHISLNIFVPPIYRLLPEERAVFDLRNGFYGDKINTIAAVAEQLHITLERAKELKLGCDRKLSEQREPLLPPLSSDEKSLFKLAYGLEDGIFRDIDAAAAQLHITPEKAREMNQSAIQKLRESPGYPINRLSPEEKSVIYSMHGHIDGILKDINAAAAQLQITPEKAGELERSALVKLTDKNQWGSIILVFVDGIVTEFGV